MSEDRIRIVATDGKQTLTIGYISCTKTYVFGQVTTDGVGDVSHTTYHENGYMHHKSLANTSDPNITSLYFGPSLQNFKGFVPTGSMAVPTDIEKLASPEFENDDPGYDSITYVDVRKTEHGMMYQAFICEPGFPVAQLIQQKRSTLQENTKLSYQVYTETDPWVGVVQWKQASGIHGLDASSNFRPMFLGVAAKANHHPYSNPCPNGEYGCDGPDGDGPLCIDCYRIIRDD